MKKVAALFFTILIFACGEKLIDKPENLIEKNKMIDVLTELAIVNAAKSANLGLLRDNKIQPTTYIFTKFNIDSLQFVESNNYYASNPAEYENIYIQIDSNLNRKKAEFEEAKKINDSLSKIDKDAKLKEARAAYDTLNPVVK